MPFECMCPRQSARWSAVSLQDPVAIRLRHGALYGLPWALVAACWVACYASSAAGLFVAMHGASVSTKVSLCAVITSSNQPGPARGSAKSCLPVKNCMKTPGDTDSWQCIHR